VLPVLEDLDDDVVIGDDGDDVEHATNGHATNGHAPMPLAITPERVQGFDLSPTDRREFCVLHGWVGRLAFQRDRHDLCEVAVELAEEDDDADEDDGDDEEAIKDGPPPVLLRDRKRGYRGRNPAVARPKSINVKSLTRSEMEAEEARLRRFTESKTYARLLAQRPRTRADCVGGQRPCAYVSCKHHMYLDVNPETGSIQLNFPDREVDELVHSCVLDIADEGTHTLEQTGERMNRTRERVRQIEVKGLAKLKMGELGRDHDADDE